MYIILVSTAVLLWRKRLIELIPAKEARLEQSALTVQQLREKLGEWGGSGKKFNQAKTKEDKQVVVLEAYYMKFLHAEPEKQASNEKTPTPKAAVTTSKQSQKEEVPKSVQIELMCPQAFFPKNHHHLERFWCLRKDGLTKFWREKKHWS